MTRCFGRTKNFKRCTRQDVFFFCKTHRSQPFLWLFSLFSIAATVITVLSAFNSGIDPISEYTRGYTYYENKNYEEARQSFQDLFDYKTEYPNAAYYLGLVLHKLNRHSEALLTWEFVPAHEEHYNLNFLRGLSALTIQDYQNSEEYFTKAIPEVKPYDQILFWQSRMYALYSKMNRNLDPSIYQSISEYCEIVDNNISMNSSGTVKANTKMELDLTIFGTLLSQKQNCFFLLNELFLRLYSKKEYHLAFNCAIRAGNYMDGPFTTPLDINPEYYRNYLLNLSGILRNINNDFKNDFLANETKLYDLLNRIKESNKSIPQISDIALIIRSIYFDMPNPEIIKQGDFYVTYECNVQDDKGIARFKIDPLPFSKELVEVNAGNSKTYSFNRSFLIEKGMLIDSNIKMKVTAVDNEGGITSAEILPSISVKDF